MGDTASRPRTSRGCGARRTEPAPRARGAMCETARAMGAPTTHEPPRTSRGLYLQVLAAIALGALLGALAPQLAVKMKPLGDGFVRLIKMVIAPIVFATIVTGI